MKEEKLDLDEVKLFYEPHPGYAGAIIPIPAPVKKVADELNGQAIPLRDALCMIEAVTNGEVDIDSNYKNIGLKIKHGYVEHVWRVIKYR